MACLAAADPTAIAILRASLPAPGEGEVAGTAGAGLALAPDGVVLCPLALYVDVARGRDVEEALAAYSRSKVDARLPSVAAVQALHVHGGPLGNPHGDCRSEFHAEQQPSP